MKKRCRDTIVMVLILVLILIPCSAFASSGMEKTDGTVKFNLCTQSGDAVGDVQISVYRVGNVDYEGYNVVYKIDELLSEGKDIPLNSLTADQNISSAERIWNLIKNKDKKDFSVWTEKTDSEGKISLDKIPVGVYLAVQTLKNDTYVDITPFVFYMPEASKEGWVYDVTLYPKVEKRPTPTPSITPKPTVPHKDDSELPDTGMVQWPIPVLAGLGVILLSVGWIVNRRRKA